MPFSLNRVELLGRLGAKAEISETSNGTPMAKFRLAVTDTWKDRDGRTQERTEWASIVVFGDIARSLARVPKGGRIAIAGKMQTNEITDRNGNRRWFTSIVVNDPGDVVFIDFDEGGPRDDHRSAPPTRRDNREPQRWSPPRDPAPTLDDDIPF